jgi:isoleucyl-tRNA synthetase
MAPLTPFVTERVWQDVVRPVDAGAAESVHMASWPSFDQSLVVEGLDASVQQARRVVELGRSARAEAKVRTRQPLRRVLVGSGAWSALSDDLRAEVAAELNVGSVDSLADVGGDLVDHEAKASFRALGKRFGKQTPAVAAAIAAADAAGLAESLRSDGRAVLMVDGTETDVLADEVIVSERPREGWSVVNEQGETVALDLELTPELVRAGLAREAIRLVQEARKASGFDVSDRIELWWQASGELAEALAEHTGLLAEEVLATAITGQAPPDTSLPAHEDEELGLTLWLRRHLSVRP